MISRVLRGIVFLFLGGFAFAQSAASDVDIPALLEKVMHNQREMNKQITEYTATNKFTLRSFDDHGGLREEKIEISENYQSSRRNVEVVLARDGKPLSERKIEKERKEAVKLLTEDEAERLKTAAMKQDGRGPEFGFVFSRGGGRIIRIGSFELFRAGEFFNMRSGEWHGRPMFVVDFRPRKDYQPAQRMYEPLAHLAGTVWIDTLDLVTARIEAFLENDRDRKNPAFVLENQRMSDGIWLATLTRVNAASDAKIFNDLNYEWISAKSNYQRFSAQAGDVKLDAPKRDINR